VAKTLTRSKPRPAQPDVSRTKFVRHAIVAAPASAPAVPPRPRGVLDTATADDIREIAASTWPLPASRRGSRDRGLRRLLPYLAEFPGVSWQQRWDASGLNERGRPVRALGDTSGQATELTQALEGLLCLRVVQPTLEAFRSNHFVDIPEAFRVAQADEQLDGFFTAVAGAATSRHFQRRATFDVCCALITQGIAFADLTPEAFLHYARATRDSGLASYSYATYVGHLACRSCTTPGTSRVRHRQRCGPRCVHRSSP
jgi:hypothetical protein